MDDVTPLEAIDLIDEAIKIGYPGNPDAVKLVDIASTRIESAHAIAEKVAKKWRGR